MSRHMELAEEVLELVGDRAAAEVLVDVGTSSLTRFANSFIHQNVSEVAHQIDLKVATPDGRIASSTSTGATSDALARFVDSTLAVARQQPVDTEWPGLGSKGTNPPVDHWDDRTAEAQPGDRAEAVRRFVEAGGGLSAAGYCQTDARHRAYANTEGRSAEGRFTTAILDGIHQTGGSAGSGHAAGRALSAIDPDAVGRRAARRARDSVEPFDTKPGEYEVVLSPECVATIAIFLTVYGFNAKASQEGMSFVDIGAPQFDPSVDVWDDATDARSLYVGFDAEGTPKARTDLVRGGVTQGLIHDRRTAAKAGVASTGNAVRGGEMWGPFATNIYVGEGSSSVDSLVASVDRGIYVSTFNYCRILDPKSLVVTGLTRNGTFMIENGQITDPVTNLRFTQSFVEALAPGRVSGVGNDGRFADSEFGPTLVHAPSLHLGAWRFTGGAEG